MFQISIGNAELQHAKGMSLRSKMHIYLFIALAILVGWGSLGLFAQFDERAACALGVEEGDVEALGALAGSLVDEAAALFFQFAQGVGHAVGDVQGHVLNAAAAAVVGNELADGAVVRRALEQLDFGLADAEKCGAHLLVGNFFDCEALDAQHVLVERNGFVERGHGDADVFDMADFHNSVI